uniref:Nucleolar protein interacting with the FHA domain of MKI67 n=1 Tax=Sphenodon punctatus TaxID=8508 RepID=A0A8D0HPI8_SPHPU
MAAVPAADPGAPASLLSLDPKLQREFQAQVQRVRKAAKQEKVTPGVIYLGHIPKGLHEPQIQEYFSAKGYAFVEFECDEVAKIVADTMHNYLFCERLLKCEFMPPEKVHENLFKGSERVFKKPAHPAVRRYNNQRSVKQKGKMAHKLLRSEKQLRKRLSKKGIDYDFPGFVSGENVGQTVSKLRKKSQLRKPYCLFSFIQDPTPVCTPTVLERRKSQIVGSDEEDTEITFKLPLASMQKSPGYARWQRRRGRSQWPRLGCGVLFH